MLLGCLITAKDDTVLETVDDFEYLGAWIENCEKAKGHPCEKSISMESTSQDE